jgi:hypothetical protein
MVLLSFKYGILEFTDTEITVRIFRMWANNTIKEHGLIFRS